MDFVIHLHYDFNNDLTVFDERDVLIEVKAPDVLQALQQACKDMSDKDKGCVPASISLAKVQWKTKHEEEMEDEDLGGAPAGHPGRSPDA